MNRSVVIAQVGAGKYKNTKYVHGDQMPPEGTVIDNPDALGINTNYSFEAVMEEVLSQKPDQMDLILAATSKSYLGSLYDVFSVESIAQTEAHLFNALQDELPEGISCLEDLFEADKPADQESEKTKIIKGIAEDKVKSVYEKNLSENMQRYFATDIPISVKVAIIDNGENSKQLQNNFSSIQDVLNDVMEKESNDWNIYFDITNGFRSFPIYIYTLINYLQKFRGSSVSKGGVMRYHMYYGMWEASKQYSTNSSQKEGEKVSVTPLVDLQVIDELLQWINAASEFQNCGSVKQILGILKMRPDWDIPIGNNDKETLSYAFEMFDYGTNSNNLAAIERGINLLTNMEEKISSEETMNDAEKLLLKSISEDFIERFWTEESRPNKPYQYSFLLIQLADWFHEMGREGNAAIVVQETVLTYLLERYAEDFKNYFLDLKELKRIDLDKVAFDKDSDLKAKEYLFNHELRVKVKPLLKELGRGDDDTVQEDVNDAMAEKLLEDLNLEDGNTSNPISGFYKRYQYIQDKVRNVMAHILPSDTAYKNYTGIIEKQIEYLKGEIIKAEKIADGKDVPNDSDTIKESLFSGEVYNEVKLSLKAKMLQGRGWKPFNALEAESGKLYSNYNTLLQEIDRMQQITDEHVSDADEGYEYFFNEKNNLGLLFKCLDELIRCSQQNNPDWDGVESVFYPKYYKKSKEVPSKKGYARLKNIIKDKWKVIIPVLESYQE